MVATRRRRERNPGGWHYHTGGHTITPEDWKAFLDFADRHLKPKS